MFGTSCGRPKKKTRERGISPSPYVGSYRNALVKTASRGGVCVDIGASLKVG